MSEFTPIQTEMEPPRLREPVVNGRDIELVMGGEGLSGWSGLTITRSLDAACDAWSFSVPWTPTPENIERFRPFEGRTVEIRLAGERIGRGYIEQITASTGADSRSLNLQGRSTTGVLLEWSAGPPFEFQEMTFNDIAKQIAAPNDVKAIPDIGPLSDVAVDIGQSVYGFLADIAKASGLWALPTRDGALRFVRLDPARASVADLQEGSSPVLGVTARHDVTSRNQKYLVVSQNDGDPLSQFEVSDPELLGIAIRGRKVAELRQESSDLQQAANVLRSEALIRSYDVNVVVASWTHPGADGRPAVWSPGDIVRLHAPGAFVVRTSRFIIKTVELSIDESGGAIASLNMGFPEAYGNTAPGPGALPWKTP